MRAFFEMLVRRPGMAGAVVVASLIAGALSVVSLPVAFYPSVVRPTISVSCSYPGANAREVMNTVAGPIEDQVNGVEGFVRMTSSCGDSGSYSLTVSFQAGFDRDLALMKVQAAVQQALSQLPQEVKNTGVTVGIGQSIDLGYVTCYSEHGELTRDEVVDYVFGIIGPALQRIQGVGAASTQDEKLAMRVWLDPDRMAAMGINTDEVVAAIKAQNVQASLGTVGASPTENARSRVISLVSKGRLHSAEEFGAIIVRTKSDGGMVYLRDIAKIGLGHESYAHAGMFGDKPACVIHLWQLPGANTLETIAEVKGVLTELGTRFPGDLKWDMTIDVSRYSASALLGASWSLVLAALLALVVVWIKFRSIRIALATMISLLVVTSIVATAMAIADIFITVLTLYAITAAIAFAGGVLAYVTSAWRNRRLETTRVPVLSACAAVTAASLVLLLVAGVQGLILRQFAVVFVAAGVATAIVSLVVTPALCEFMRVTQSDEALGCATTAFPPGSKFIAFGAVIAMALAAMSLAMKMPNDLVPNEDFGVILVDVKTKNGTSRPKVVDVVRKILDRANGVCDIEKTCTVLGEGVFSPSGEDTARICMVLKPWSERGKGESTMDMIARIRKVVSDIPEADISLLTMTTVPGLGTASYVSPLVFSTADNDPVRLANEAHRLQAILRQSPLADSVLCGYNTDAPHLRIKVDRAKCEMLNVPLSTLFSTLQHYLGSIYINDINLGIQVNRVTLMSDWSGRSDPDMIAGLHVRSSTGAMVPVSALVDYEEELGPSAIYRYNRYIYCSVDMAQKPGVSLQDAMDEIKRVFARELPPDYDMGWSGIAYEESSNPGQTGLMTVLSVLAAYLVLLIRFKSWTRAFFAMVPTVAAVFGAVLVLFVSGVPISLYSRFALVVLVVVNSAFSLFADVSVSWRKFAYLPLMAAMMSLPLIFSSGAGEMGSRSFGVALAGGYAFYAFVGLLLLRTFGMHKSNAQ